MHDYVIVGAGSAGCVLAARLTEDPDVSVCLVEAGGPDTAEEIHMPVAFSAMFKTGLDWDLVTEPEPGLDNRRIYLPRGKMLGGSSSINAMVYIRGNRADYDEWAADGAEGWGYDDVLPYFKRAEDNERGEDEFHGAGGPLSVSEGRSMHPLTDAIVEADGRRPATSATPTSTAPARRASGASRSPSATACAAATAVAYLHPAMARPNLEVITGALTTRILFDGDRAVGVEISRDGQLEEIRAEREVILSAGAYQSPVIMMLSGIGPAADLEAMMIEVREDLPVGENLQDHPMVRSELPDRRAVAVRGADAGEHRAARDRGPRAADLEHRRGRRLHPHAPGPRRARRPVPLRAGAVLRRGPAAPVRPRLRASGRAC